MAEIPLSDQMHWKIFLSFLPVPDGFLLSLRVLLVGPGKDRKERNIYAAGSCVCNFKLITILGGRWAR